MQTELKRLPVSCVLLGDTNAEEERMMKLQERLNALGVRNAAAECGDSPLEGARAAMARLRPRGEALCVAAGGEMWAAAIALAEQVRVDRIVLFGPVDMPGRGGLSRLKGFARRNLSLCVSDVLVFPAQGEDAGMRRRMESVWSGMCNAHVERFAEAEKAWTNCELSPIQAAVRFLCGAEFVK